MKNFLLFLVILTMTGSFVYAQSEVSVAPGDGTLSQAITDAVDGDILLLVPDALYSESAAFSFGTIVDKNITIAAEGDGSTMAQVQILTAPDGESNAIFFKVGNNASLTLSGLELDGSYNDAANAEYLVQWYMGEFPAPTTVKKIKLENCYIHDFNSHVLSAGNGDMKANVIVDSTLIDNVVMENTGTSIYYKYAGSNYVSVTNSTFNGINSYGIRIAGPGENSLPDNTPVVVIDHTTWYNIGWSDGREIILGEKGPILNQWTVSNSILVKQVEKSKTVINIKDMPTPDLATINNICLWDVGVRNWRDHPVSDTLAIDPEFADPDNGDFTLPEGSQLLTFASDGGAIGDPRWAANAPTAVEGEKSVPSVFALSQNYPNPFNPNTCIDFRLEKSGLTRLTVYDLLGRNVATLVNENLTAGQHRVLFDAANLPSGIYVYQLNSAGEVLTRKMMLLK